MRMSDLVAQYILEMLEQQNGSAEIQRNELAGNLGCVPSQINYVITSRFTPEAGYRIESRRGGGGYILISRADNSDTAIMSLINSIGDSVDERSAKANLINCNYQKLINDKATKMMVSAVADSNYKGIPKETANLIRAKQLKQMLLAYID